MFSQNKKCMTYMIYLNDKGNIFGIINVREIYYNFNNLYVNSMSVWDVVLHFRNQMSSTTDGDNDDGNLIICVQTIILSLSIFGDK